MEELEPRCLLATLPQAVFTVTSNDDLDDGVCDVSHCSLREAIQAANGSFGADLIRFNIPVAGVPTIRPDHELPTIADPVTIDGRSQPGGKVELDGTHTSQTGSGPCGFWTNPCGLVITAGNSIVRGMVINRFGGVGVFLTEKGGNTLEGNFIGTDVAGKVALGNLGAGVLIVDSPNNLIGGTSGEARNVISGNGLPLQTNTPGIAIGGDQPTGNRVQGNFIGTDVTGTTSLGNSGDGLRLDGISDTTVGGEVAGSGNVISGNLQAGITINGGSRIIVQGNLIGTDSTGTLGLGNGSEGISLFDESTNNRIGGTVPAARNVISANGSHGISIGWGSNGNAVQGNFIGTDISGTRDLGNAGDGVVIQEASGILIGGTEARAGNTIAFNIGNGVRINPSADFPTTGTGILSNSIFSNALLGIDLDGDGITPNDPGDGDSGANDLQNSPVLLRVSTTGRNKIHGALHSTPHTRFRIDLFAGPPGGISQPGDGGQFLRAFFVTTDGNGDAAFATRLRISRQAGRSITATATDPDNNTSEFATPVRVPGRPNPRAVFTVNSSDDVDDGACNTAHCSLREAIQDANTNLGLDAIAFHIPGTGVPTIRADRPLPPITDPVTIDGTTQLAGRVELDGSNAHPSPDEQCPAPICGLVITAGGSVVRGMVINRFNGMGIYLSGRGGNVIEGNLIGTDVTGTLALGNLYQGVFIDGSPLNTIGGTTARARNVISGNGGEGR